MAIPRNLANIAPHVAGSSGGITGLTFNATQSASANANTLDDYEEGTWTPDFSPASGSFSSISWAPRLGRYVKIGNHVWISAAWNIDGISVGTASGDCRISGIPFSPVVSTRWWSSGVAYTSAWTNAPTGIAIYSTQTSLLMTRSSGATGITGITVADLNTGFPNKNEIGFTICFQV